MAFSHKDIDADLVRRLVAAQFPQWAALPIARIVPGGWDNQSFRLGDELLVRLPSAAEYAAQVDKEQRWLPWLAGRLPLAIPEPVALGRPAEGYPWSWSVYRWIDRETAHTPGSFELSSFALDLADFLRALRSCDATGGPEPGDHNFFRGASL